MAENVINKILTCSPVDKRAALTVAQGGCDDDYHDLTREELLFLRVQVEQRFIEVKLKLGIRNSSHSANVRTRYRKGVPKYTSDPLVAYFTSLGDQIERIARRLAENHPNPTMNRRATQIMGRHEAAWKLAHPGYTEKVHGVLVAPNGDTYSRKTAALTCENEA